VSQDAPEPTQPPRVTFFHAESCSLCDRARVVIERVRAEVPFELEEIDITGVPELEARYREWLPVVEIAGERAFVYFVDAESLRRRLHKVGSR
jgi:thiol-disulfide isomerase/thioredoxin